jgi:hypothetical protein
MEINGVIEMTDDPKITDTLLYGEGVCREQRTCESCIWDDEWVVFGDQYGRFGEVEAKHVAVQFRRRPPRQRYIEPPFVPVPSRVKELEDA